MTKAGYTIRRAESQDEATLVRLLERFITTQGAVPRYEWIYKQNPQGRATTWLACEPVRHQIVGFTSIFAREFSIEGRQVVGGVGFDAFVRPDHRRRGLAVALHQASRVDMTAGEVPYRFMCGPPVPANLNALVKAGTRVVGGLRYLSLPLTARSLLDMLHVRRGVEPLAKRLERFDGLLRQVHRIVSRVDGRTTVRMVERLDRRFDELWDVMSDYFPVIGRRDATYLEWRYLHNPVCRQELIAFEERGRLLGWAALEFSPKGCLVLDYLFPFDLQAGSRALGALIGYVAGRGASRLTLRFNLKGRYTRLFLRHGFLPGWSKDLFQVLCGDPSLLPSLLDPAGWQVASGDLNPEASPWSVNTAPQAEWTDCDYVCGSWPPDDSAEPHLALQATAEG